MSKRGQKSQSKVFVSFGDVSGFNPVDSYDKKTAVSSVPLYTGDDNDLAAVSKKVMKKDPTTKLKAMQELGDILQSKPEHSIAEFMSFFVHCFSKLCLEDSRTVREKLCSSIDAITSVEKRLLGPHMKTLIGPWWMLTGDPAAEVADKAYGAFCSAIPPKKRQQVLVHLSAPILGEAVRNMQQRPDTLSDMSVATAQEAEERLERVLVSTLASISKFVSLLAPEQNYSLLKAAEGDEQEEQSEAVCYRDLFNDKLWSKCLGSKYASVRKATYQLLDCVLTHIPAVVRVSDDDSAAVSSVFCTQFVKCLLEETHFPNMESLVNSFVMVVKHLKSFLHQVSVHDGVVPVMHRLMKTHPKIALEYLLPIAGCLPAEHVALLEASLEQPMRDQSLDALCEFLRSLTAYAEAQASEGVQESQPVATSKRKRLEDHKQALLRVQKADCAVSSMRTDVCVVELATLLLLRRTHTSASEGSVTDISTSVRVQEVVSQLAQSIVLTIQSAAVAMRSELAKGAATDASKKGGHLRKALSAAARNGQNVDTSAVVCEAARTALHTVAKSLVQLQRATLLGIHLTSSEWTSLLWRPLGESVLDLLVSTTGDAEASAEEDAKHTIESMLGSLAVIDAIIKAFAPAWSEKVENVPNAPDALSSFGAHSLTASLVDHARSMLDGERPSNEPLAVTARAVMQGHFLLALSDRSSGLLGRAVTVSTIVELIAGSWWMSVLPWFTAPTKHVAAVANVLACALADTAAFLSLSSPSNEVVSASSRLASFCVDAGSVEGACIVCKLLNKSSELSRGAWTASTIEWVRSTGVQFLSGGGECSASPRLRLKFLLLFSANSAMRDAPGAWLQLVRDSWSDSRVALSELFQLTLLVASLDPNRGISIISVVKNATTAWAQDEQKQLHDCLTRLFFARIRTRDYKLGKALPCVELAPLKDVPFVTSWAEVQEFLLPVLPREANLSLQDSIAAVLNASLLPASDYNSGGVADDDVDADGDGPVSPAKGRDGNQRSSLAPRKWVRHFRGLIAVGAQTCTLQTDLTSPWKLLCINYWSDRVSALSHHGGDLSGELQTTLFALECFQLLLADDAMRDSAVLGHLQGQPMVLSWILLAVEQMRLVQERLSNADRVLCDTLGDQILHFTRQLPNANKVSFYSASLAPFFAAGSPLGLQINELRLAVVRHLLGSEFSVGAERREAIRLQSPTLRRDERVTLGTPGVFLSWKPVGASPSDAADSASNDGTATATQLMKITPIPCKLAAVHKEGGADPFFTISMDYTGDVNIAHELQVEWPKFLLSRHFPPGAEDLVVTLTPQVTSQGPRCQQNASDHQDSLLHSLTSWLISTFAELFLSVPSTVDAPLVDLYLAVLRQTLGAIAQESRPERDAFELSVLAPVRGAVLYLLSPKCTSAEAQRTGVLLLQAVLSSDVGAGFGLWLPAVLNHLRRVVIDVCGGSTPLLAVCLDTMAQLVHAVPQWDMCAETAELLLAPAIAAVASASRELGPKILGLLHAVWVHHSEQRGVKAEVPVLSSLAAWEVEGFDFALFALVEGISGFGDSTRLEACAALHFCLLKRSRRSCQELLSTSLMEIFSERLQRVVCGDFAASVTKLVETEECKHTLRLTCCKLLDAWEASRREDSSAAAAKSEKASASPAEEEQNLQEEERRELEQDGDLLAEVVGNVYITGMNRLFKVTEADANRTAATNLSLEAPVDEAEEEDPAAADLSADNASEVAESDRFSESQFTSSSKTSHRIISKRNTLRVMVERDPLGAVLLWLLVLQRVDARAVEGWTVRARCVNFLKKTGMATNVMFLLVKLSGDLLKFKDVSALLQRVGAVHSVAVQANADGRRRQVEQSLPGSAGNSIAVGTLQHLATYALFRTVCTLPAMFRSFWSDDCNRVQKQNLSKFIEDRVRNSLVSREIALIALSSAAGRWDTEEFAVRGSAVSGEITAVLTREETTIEIKVKLPPSYPLKNVDVTCTSRIGVSDGRWRRWVLQIIQLLSIQDGSVVDAVLMWKVNIEKELEGVEPCPICYCTLHTKTLCLPTLACPTCNNKFHQPCLHTWFRSSGKNKCVICQQPFPH